MPHGPAADPPRRKLSPRSPSTPLSFPSAAAVGDGRGSPRLCPRAAPRHRPTPGRSSPPPAPNSLRGLRLCLPRLASAASIPTATSSSPVQQDLVRHLASTTAGESRCTRAASIPTARSGCPILPSPAEQHRQRGPTVRRTCPLPQLQSGRHLLSSPPARGPHSNDARRRCLREEAEAALVEPASSLSVGPWWAPRGDAFRTEGDPYLPSVRPRTQNGY